MSDTEYAPEPPIGSIVTDNGKGWPWIRTVGGNWTRDACATFLTWAEVHEWHQRAVDDPDDDTTEPFKPVVMVPALATTGGETEWGLRDDETGHVTVWNGRNYAAHPDHRNFSGYTVVTRIVPPWIPWEPAETENDERNES